MILPGYQQLCIALDVLCCLVAEILARPRNAFCYIDEFCVGMLQYDRVGHAFFFPHLCQLLH